MRCTRNLSELEENAKAGEPVEEIKKELEKPKKRTVRRNFPAKETPR